jgi:hypothetical protein
VCESCGLRHNKQLDEDHARKARNNVVINDVDDVVDDDEDATARGPGSVALLHEEAMQPQPSCRWRCTRTEDTRPGTISVVTAR